MIENVTVTINNKKIGVGVSIARPCFEERTN